MKTSRRHAPKKVKASATDTERFEATWEEWTSMAEAALVDIRKTGVDPVKVLITASELTAWRFLRNKVNDAGTRAEFVSEKVQASD